MVSLGPCAWGLEIEAVGKDLVSCESVWLVVAVPKGVVEDVERCHVIVWGRVVEVDRFIVGP